MTHPVSANAPVRLRDFTAKLLAPLPAAAAPILTAGDRALILEQHRIRWSRGYDRYRAARATVDYYGAMCAIARDEGHDATTFALNLDFAHQACFAHVDALMRLPAPSRAQLRWKRDHDGYFGGSDEWDAAIAADDLRLGKRG